MNIYDFLATYSRLAHDIATKDEIDMAYFELEGLVKNTTIENLFTKSNPNRLDKILSIDSVAHNFHSKNPQLLDDIFPGSDYAVVKHELDKLAGYEVTSDIRKANRGFFTTMLAEEGLFFLEKGIGKVSSNEISTEMEHYEILYEAQLKAPGIDMLSNAELLTLYRYYNDNKYAQMINERGLNKNKPIIVGGYASVIIIDRQGHLITKAALEEAFIGFMKSFRTSSRPIWVASSVLRRASFRITSRAMMGMTLSQSSSSNWAACVSERPASITCTAKSSKSRVRRGCRSAHYTGIVFTPCSGQRVRGTRARMRVVNCITSRWRQVISTL